jgi:predicted ATP-binding protein involved in virulence
MRIDRLTLKNFRSFKERTFYFHPEFNVIIGENGSGKTAILEALTIAAGSWFLGMRSQKSRVIRRDDVRFAGYTYGGETVFEEQFPVEVCVDGIIDGETISWKRTLSKPGGHTTVSYAKEIKELAAVADQRVRDGEPVVLPIISYYGTARLWLQPRDSMSKRSSTSKRDMSRFEGYHDSLDNRVSPRDLTRWLERQDRIAYREGHDSGRYKIVLEAMRRMVEHATEVKFDNKRLEVVVHFDDREPQPFGHLSDGQRNMLALAGDIAVRMARLNPQFGDSVLASTPGVVLIDELDLHLHPNWQRNVVEDLRQTFPKVQFITTTHSPFIIQTLREGEMLSLDEVQPVPVLENLGIEEIASGIMGVENPEVSPRYQEMVQTAKDYLTMLDEAALTPKDRLQDFKEKLAARIKPYADNPAFQAFLEMERVAKLGE